MDDKLLISLEGCKTTVLSRGRRAKGVRIIAGRHMEMPTNAVFYVYGHVDRLAHKLLRPSLVEGPAAKSALFLAPTIRRDTRVVSFYTSIPSVSDTWHPITPGKGQAMRNVEPHVKRALVVYLNSVLGVYNVLRGGPIPDFSQLSPRRIERVVDMVNFDAPLAELGRHVSWASNALRAGPLHDPDKIQQVVRGGPRGPIDAAAIELVEELCGGHIMVDLSIYRTVSVLL